MVMRYDRVDGMGELLRSYVDGAQQEPVTPAAAERAAFGAEAARVRMLKRQGLITEEAASDTARQRMIERQQRRGSAGRKRKK